MSKHLRFAPDVLRRLGEELNPSVEQGVLELVRNAYDADASRCTVKLIGVTELGGRLTIDDNGIGMTQEQLEDAFLVLGRSSKDPHARTPKYGRLPVGSKGLGRLAALRLGEIAEVRTRPESEPGTEYHLIFEWGRFDRVKTVDRVAFVIEISKTKLRPGTTIEVRDLKRWFNTNDVTRMARSLVLLSDPFQSHSSFRPKLLAPEFKELEQLVRVGYWDQAAYEIHAEVESNGHAHATMIDHERAERVVEADHKQLRRARGKPPYVAPEAEVKLWVFRLSGDASTRGRTSGVTLTALREWLAVAGGVHLFHRGLRVHPYGDRGHDWLDMNLRRVSSPEERPSTNNTIGQVSVLDKDAVLQQKTDRSGFIETAEFEDLRAFVQDVLEWAAGVRLKEAEKRRERERRKASQSLASAQERMERTIASAPPEIRKALKKASRQMERATTREVETLESDLTLYRTLATIGTTTAVMAHESFNPPNTIIKLAQSVRRRGRRLLGKRYIEMEEPVDLIESNARRMATLVSIPRRLLDRSKRRRGTFSANEVVSETLSILGPLLEDHRVRLERELDADAPTYLGTMASMESIVANLIINAVNALDRSSSGDRLIRVRTASVNGSILLDIADNGPGVRNIDLDEIWLPGHGTTDRGVGLGLTIVRDILSDMEGKISVHARGELGGAQFTIEIPRVEE
jgi:signal transduction histidine kinase